MILKWNFHENRRQLIENGWMFTVFRWIFSFFKPYLLFLFTFNTANVINQLSKFSLLTDYFAIASGLQHLRLDTMISVRKRHLFSTWNWLCLFKLLRNDFETTFNRIKIGILFFACEWILSVSTLHWISGFYQTFKVTLNFMKFVKICAFKVRPSVYLHASRQMSIAFNSA